MVHLLSILIHTETMSIIIGYPTKFANFHLFLTFSSRFPRADMLGCHQISRDNSLESIATHLEPKTLSLQQVVTVATEPRLYFSYLLRLWQTMDEGQLVWRASLENPHTGERRGFANLQMLHAFLEETCSTEDCHALSPSVEYQTAPDN